MPEPDDAATERKEEWKKKIYGHSFDYQNIQTQKKIWDNYAIDRPFRVALIYEGDTEDVVIKMIFDALYVDHERDGVFLHNAKGQGNIRKNLASTIELAKAEGTDVFIILDHDANWQQVVDDFKRMGYIRNGMFHVWEKDFESDNFSADDILRKVNDILVQKSYLPLEMDIIRSKIKNPNLNVTKAIANSIWEMNKVKLDKVISKRQLGEILIQDRIADIRKERSGEG